MSMDQVSVRTKGYVRIEVHLGLSLAEEFEATRGDVPSAVYIRRLIEQDVAKARRAKRRK